MATDEHELQLIQRAGAGDRVALTLLLKCTRRRLGDHLARRIPRRLQAALDADDLIQQAQTEVFRRIGGFEARGPESFYRWVAAIGLGKLRDAIKRERAGKRGGGRAVVAEAPGGDVRSMITLLDLIAAPSRTPSRSAARHEQVDALRVALGRLPEHYAQAVRLVYFDGQPVAEAARLMGKTPRAVHGLCRRALELLRSELASTCLSFSAVLHEIPHK